MDFEELMFIEDTKEEMHKKGIVKTYKKLLKEFIKENPEVKEMIIEKYGKNADFMNLLFLVDIKLNMIKTGLLLKKLDKEKQAISFFADELRKIANDLENCKEDINE